MAAMSARSCARSQASRPKRYEIDVRGGSHGHDSDPAGYREPVIVLLVVPYHLGRRGVGMGAGPFHLLDAGLEQTLRSFDPDLEVEWVELAEPFRQEVEADFGVNRALAARVAAVRERGKVPFVLGGNCSCAVATTAGDGDVQRRGVVWFDAHADAHTPDTSSSGFLEGMPVAVLTGRAWTKIAASIDRFAPVADETVLLAGVRSMETAERELVDASGITVVPPDGLGAGSDGLDEALARLAGRVDDVHLHVDLDVIDPSQGRANEYAAPGGPSVQDVCEGIVAVGRHCAVDSVSLTSYNPNVDVDSAARSAGSTVAESLARLVTRSQ